MPVNISSSRDNNNHCYFLIRYNPYTFNSEETSEMKIYYKSENQFKVLKQIMEFLDFLKSEHQ